MSLRRLFSCTWPRRTSSFPRQHKLRLKRHLQENHTRQSTATLGRIMPSLGIMGRTTTPLPQHSPTGGQASFYIKIFGYPPSPETQLILRSSDMGKARNETQPSRMGDAFNAGRRETRIPSRGAPGGIRRPGRIVGLHGWRVGPIVLSEEKAVEACTDWPDRAKVSMVTTTTLSRRGCQASDETRVGARDNGPCDSSPITGQETETQPCQ